MAEMTQKKIDRYGRRLEAQRLRELGYSTDAIKAIFQNAMTTSKGIASTVSTANDRIMSKLLAASQRSATQSATAVNGLSSGMVGQYGGLYGGAVAQQMAFPQAQAAATEVAGKAAAVTNRGMQRAGTLGRDIQLAGLATAQASAEYALAQAAIARARADADATAQMQLQYDINSMNKTGAALDAKFPGITEVANLASSVAKEVRDVIAEQLDSIEQNGGNLDLSVVAQTVAQRLLLTSGEEGQLVAYIARQIHTQNLVQRGRGSREPLIDLITNAVMLSYSGDVPASARLAVRAQVASQLAVLYGDAGNEPPVDPTATTTIYGTQPRTSTDSLVQPGNNIYGTPVRTEASPGLRPGTNVYGGAV